MIKTIINLYKEANKELRTKVVIKREEAAYKYLAQLKKELKEGKK